MAKLKIISLIFSVIIVVHANDDDGIYRLPGGVIPKHYNITLDIYLDATGLLTMFYGTAKIDLSVTQELRTITLSNKHLVLSLGGNVNLVNTETNAGYSIRSATVDNPREMYGLNFGTTVPVGNYILDLEDFFGYVESGQEGLTISSYYNNGVSRKYATTFSSPINARMVFPCFDEPEYKATFSIEITHDSNYNIVFNTPIESVSESGIAGYVTTKFEDTPLMSTYQIGFAITDFMSISNTANNFMIYAPPDIINETSYALEYGQAALAQLEEYFNSKYQLPEMSFFVIDEEKRGSMGNWGLIQFARGNILVNDETDIETLQTITKTITHELARQWFGNEMSPFWWSAVWLNEGLATFFEDFIINILKPDWKIMEQFVVNTMQTVMLKDNYKNTKYMNTEVNTLTEMREIFDFVSYEKTASVIRMIKHVMTESVFQKAIQELGKSKSSGIVRPEHLYEIFQQAIDTSSQTIVIPSMQSVFESWTNNPGFPIISAIRNYDTSTVTVSQQRFVSAIEPNEIFDTKYYVPINYVTAGSPDFSDTSATHWLKPTNNSLLLPLDVSGEWVILNTQATGYYRVNYDEDNWRKIINEINGENYVIIANTNRAQLIDDVMILAKYGHVSYDISLDLIRYIKQETDYVPIKAAFRNLKELQRSLRSENTLINEFLLELGEDLYENLGMKVIEDDNHVRRVLRKEVTLFACQYGLPACLNDAVTIFKENMESTIEPDIRPAVFCGAMKHPTAVINNYIQLIYRLSALTTSAEYRMKYKNEIEEMVESLACIEDDDIQEIALNMTIYDRVGINFEKNDFNKIFKAIIGGSYSGTLKGLNLMKSHMGDIEKRFESLLDVYETIGANIVSTELYDLFKEVLEIHFNPTRAFQADIAETIDDATKVGEENLTWNEKNMEIIKKWLEERNKSGGNSAGSLVTNFSVVILMIFLINFVSF